VKFGPCGQDQTEPRLRALVNEQAQQLERGGVHPVQIFDNEQDWLALRFGM
jgi:hypothetical protein